jgi:membrane protease YdiL (CAAX protease family)
MGDVCTRLPGGVLMRGASILAPALLGALLFAVNSLFFAWVLGFGPYWADLTYGRGSWWLGEPFWVKAAYVGLFGPFFEELVFRRLLLGWYAKNKSPKFGLAVSSVAFGLWHMVAGWGPLKAAAMTLAGAAFGAVYLRWGFRGSLVSHYANNLFAVAAMAAA